MKIFEKTGDVLSDATTFETLLVTTPANYQMAGLSAVLDREYGISRTLNYLGFNLCPDCVYTCPVMILVAQNNEESRPSLEQIEAAFSICRKVCEYENVNLIAMPPVYTKHYPWAEIKKIIIKTFAETDVVFNVYFRQNRRN